LTPLANAAADIEIELKFLVPAASRAALAAELTGRGTAQRVSLADAYLDTPDLRLARAGLAAAAPGWALGAGVEGGRLGRAGAL
jgi:CYTH domain